MNRGKRTRAATSIEAQQSLEAQQDYKYAWLPVEQRLANVKEWSKGWKPFRSKTKGLGQVDPARFDPVSFADMELALYRGDSDTVNRWLQKWAALGMPVDGDQIQTILFGLASHDLILRKRKNSRRLGAPSGSKLKTAYNRALMCAEIQREIQRLDGKGIGPNKTHGLVTAAIANVAAGPFRIDGRRVSRSNLRLALNVYRIKK